MAELSATALQDAIIVAQGSFGNFENRMSEYGVLKAFLDSTPMLLPGQIMNNIKKSPVQVTKIPSLKRSAVTPLTARTCAITGTQSTSQFTTLSWATTGFTIKTTPSKYAGNYITEVEDYGMQLANGLRATLAALDTAGYTALDNAKATWLVSSKLATSGTGEYELTAANFYKNAPFIMRENDVQGPFINIANTSAGATMLGMLTYGANNQQNQAGLLGVLPMSGQFNNYFSNRVSPGSNLEIHFMAAEGSLGVFTWNNFEHQNAVVTSDGKKFFTRQDPVLGLTWDVTQYTVCETDSDYQQVVSTYEQWALDYAMLLDYSTETTTGPLSKSPIIKFACAS